MLLETIGDTAAVEAVLQLAHAVMVEGGAVDHRVGHDGISHGGLGADVLRVLLHSRPPSQVRRRKTALTRLAAPRRRIPE
jgi:hypothetical protein